VIVGELADRDKRSNGAEMLGQTAPLRFAYRRADARRSPRDANLE
jgi:hypothetical protein